MEVFLSKQGSMTWHEMHIDEIIERFGLIIYHPPITTPLALACPILNGALCDKFHKNFRSIKFLSRREPI